MSEWDKSKGQVKNEFNYMDKLIGGYSYRDPDHTEKTDEKLRKLVADEINKSRDFLFPMIEAAYLDKDMKSAGPLDEIMQWLDIFLLELGLRMNWSEVADYKDYMRLIKFDVTLIKNSKKLTQILEKMQNEVLNGRGGSGVPKKCLMIKKYVTDLMTVFKRRRHALGG
jgi:hypothetical protein